MGSYEEGILVMLTGYQNVSSTQSIGQFNILTFLPDFFYNLYTVITFQNSVFTGAWAIIDWLVFLPITAGLIFGIATIFILLFRILFN